MLKKAAVVIFLLIGSAAEAEEIHVYRCDAPRGYRADYAVAYDAAGKPLRSTSESIRWETDSFSITPTVVWNEADPGKLLVSWGHTVPTVRRI